MLNHGGSSTGNKAACSAVNFSTSASDVSLTACVGVSSLGGVEAHLAQCLVDLVFGLPRDLLRLRLLEWSTLNPRAPSLSAGMASPASMFWSIVSSRSG